MSNMITDTENTAKQTSRPSVMTLAIKEKNALYAAYMPFVENGGLFVPTQRPAQLGDDLYLILTLLDDPAKLAVPGKVVWVTPAGATGRQQGIGIQFTRTEASALAREKIEQFLGPVLKSPRPTNTI
jgi:type IV pilus assembly protein PilZ